MSGKLVTRLLLAGLVMAGCTLLTSEKGSGNAPVPHFCTTNVETGDPCFGSDICMWSEEFTGGRVPATHTCRCEFEQYRCASCPSNVTDPGATCIAGDKCDFQTFEVCDCTCDQSGHWECIGRESHSNCVEVFPPDDPFPVDAPALPL
jgi:hypothetical protein